MPEQCARLWLISNSFSLSLPRVVEKITSLTKIPFFFNKGRGSYVQTLSMKFESELIVLAHRLQNPSREQHVSQGLMIVTFILGRCW